MAIAEDDLLVHRISHRDETAMAAVMRRYGPSLLHYTQHLTGDAWAAEEIVQDTMFKAWELSGQLNGSLKYWLYRVARNAAIDYSRRKRFPVAEATERISDTGQPAVECEHAWLCAEVRQAIADLPPVYRMVVQTHFFGGWKYEEIAEALDIPSGTVKSRLSYAKKHLRQRLRHLIAEEELA